MEWAARTIVLFVDYESGCVGLVIWKLGLRPSFILNETSFSSLDLDDGALDLWVHGPLMNCVGYKTILEFDVRT